MKKLLTLTLVAILALVMLCGCMGMDEPMESMLPDMNQNNNSGTNDLQPSDNSQNSDNNQQQTQSNVDTSRFIGEEKAKEMALAKAGISAQGVMFEHVDLELDDGVWCYDVEFKKDNMEYNVKVKADDGAILEYEKDTND